MMRKYLTEFIGTFFLVLMSALLPVAMVMLLSMVRGGEEFASAGSKFQEAASGADEHLNVKGTLSGEVSFERTSNVLPLFREDALDHGVYIFFYHGFSGAVLSLL